MAEEKVASERERWIDAVARMIELTQSGVIEWEIGETYGPGRGDPTTPPYVAEYKDTFYRLQGRWVKAQDPETYLNSAMRNFLTHNLPRPRDGEVVRLDIIDRMGRSLYRVPSVDPIRDLLKAVQRQTANPEGALQDLLG
jgi:hypothetical protein